MFPAEYFMNKLTFLATLLCGSFLCASLPKKDSLPSLDLNASMNSGSISQDDSPTRTPISRKERIKLETQKKLQEELTAATLQATKINLLSQNRSLRSEKNIQILLGNRRPDHQE